MATNEKEEIFNGMQRSAYQINAAIWSWYLLGQARKEGGKVTISVPSLDLKFTVTSEEIEKAVKKTD
jgi:hypothetical protein